VDRIELVRMTRKPDYFKYNRAEGSGKCSLQTDAIRRSAGTLPSICVARFGQPG